MLRNLEKTWFTMEALPGMMDMHALAPSNTEGGDVNVRQERESKKKVRNMSESHQDRNGKGSPFMTYNRGFSSALTSWDMRF